MNMDNDIALIEFQECVKICVKLLKVKAKKIIMSFSDQFFFSKLNVRGGIFFQM